VRRGVMIAIAIGLGMLVAGLVTTLIVVGPAYLD
jgi:hypothetical protein